MSSPDRRVAGATRGQRVRDGQHIARRRPAFRPGGAEEFCAGRGPFCDARRATACWNRDVRPRRRHCSQGLLLPTFISVARRVLRRAG